LKNTITYPVPRIIWFYFVWWLIWAFAQTAVLHRLSLSWEVALIDSFISAGLLAFFCFDVVAIFYFYQPGKGNQIYRFIFAIGLAILYGLTVKLVLPYAISEPDYLVFLVKSLPVRFVLALLVLLFVTAISWLWHNIQEQAEQEKRRVYAEQLMKDAELAKLRQQLQPHFLFNSLNSISALAGSKPNDARKMIQQLSDFLRGTLKKDDQQTVLLKDEIEHLKLYLDIEKVRFGYRLSVNISVSDDAWNAQIPPLLMQPIVENAIKFGLYDTVDEIEIKINVYVKDNFLYIDVQNPFDTETQSVNEGTGFGLTSIQRRLFLLYARNDLMTTQQIEKSFIASLKIPQTKK